MSKEARITCSLQIRKRDTTTGVTILDYLSRPTSFTADVNGSKGPVPGAFSALQAGTQVNFSQLTIPGLCRIMNLESPVENGPIHGQVNNYVEWGPFDSATGKFYPVGELYPGESFVFRLSRFLGIDMGTGTGTGSSPSSGVVSLMFKGHGKACNVTVEAFEASPLS